MVEDKTYGFATWALQAYEQACDRLGLAVLARVGGPTTDDLSMVAQGLIDETDVTALVALQEQSVIGALRAVQARGMRIPEDVSVVGMISESMSLVATPPLTTISFPADEMGSVAARMLLSRIEHGRAAAEQALVRPELTVRGSTASPRDTRRAARGPGGMDR